MRHFGFSKVLLLSPVIFVLHFIEESPGFVIWFNEHVTPDINDWMFWRVNIAALFITLLVVAFEWLSRSVVSIGCAIAWLSFLMFANAAFHLLGSVVDRQYVPGMITAAFLYLPYYFWIWTEALSGGRLGKLELLATTAAGAIPMSIHGYLILFRGSRLF